MVAIMLVAVGTWYFIAPRLVMIHPLLPKIVGWVVVLFLGIVCIEVILLVLSTLLEKNLLFPKNVKQLIISFLFPILMILGRMVGLSKQTIRKSFISVNNALVRAVKNEVSAKRILILLPQCLQNTNCKRRITVDINNCTACGQCTIGDIIALGQKYNAKITVATGGTLARKVVVETRPTAILAVACDRDLTSGIQYTHRIPTLGILNKRPEGPCVNTSVDIAEMEKALIFINKGHSLSSFDKENITGQPPLQAKVEGA